MFSVPRSSRKSARQTTEFRPTRPVTTVNVHEAKTHLSRLLTRVRTGEEVIIALAGKPIARLMSIQEKRPDRVPGSAEGTIRIHGNFDAPLPELTNGEAEE